jgi:hypothetical protein
MSANGWKSSRIIFPENHEMSANRVILSNTGEGMSDL